MCSDKNVFYDLIYPYGKKDTIDNAKIIIEHIKSQKDYETVLIRSINYKSKIILKNVIVEPKLENLRESLRKDNSFRTGERLETIKERLINSSLQSEDAFILELICELFLLKNTVIPKYKNLSEIRYIPEYYDDDFINTNTNVYYLTDNKNIVHFENVITSIRNVFYIGKQLVFKDTDTSLFKNILDKFDISDVEHGEQVDVLKQFCINYYNFIKNEFDHVINDIKNNEEKPESKNDCWGLLYEYLDRDPSSWEIDILWDNTSTW